MRTKILRSMRHFWNKLLKVVYLPEKIILTFYTQILKKTFESCVSSTKDYSNQKSMNFTNPLKSFCEHSSTPYIIFSFKYFMAIILFLAKTFS